MVGGLEWGVLETDRFAAGRSNIEHWTSGCLIE
jgi:hypothetical protein